MTTSRGVLLALAVMGVLIALMMHQQQRTERQLAMVASELDEIAKQLARPSSGRSLLPMTPPALPIDAEAIATRVAQRLDARKEARSDGEVEIAAPRPPDAPPTPAVEAAHAIVAAAVNRGQLAADDVRNLRAQLVNARPEERSEIARQIAVAINTRKLVPQDPHNIFP